MYSGLIFIFINVLFCQNEHMVSGQYQYGLMKPSNDRQLVDLIKLFGKSINDGKGTDIISKLNTTKITADDLSQEINHLKGVLKDIDFIALSELMKGNLNLFEIVPRLLTGELKLSLSCIMDLSDLAKPFLNGTINPLVLATSLLGKMIDAWGKPGSGILVGNLQWIGSIEECETEEKFHYCRSYFSFMKKYVGRYGTCLPKSCSVGDVEQILEILEGRYLKGTTLKFIPGKTNCNLPVEYKTGTKITIGLLILLAVLCLLGTITEILQDAFTPSDDFIPNFSDHINYGRLQEDQDNEIKINADITSNDITSIPKLKITRGNTLTNILISFSLIKNIKTLVSTKEVKGAISSINSIRFISMTWVILGHYYFIGNSMQNADNTLIALKEIQTFWFMPITNAYVSVDTFFLLSGLLVSYLTLRRIDKNRGMSIKQYLLYLLHRYLRLTPSLGIVILFVVYILPLLVSGPFAFEMQQSSGYQQQCYNYWWTDLLYINNFYPINFSDQCVGWVWYLANDWQFYVISPGIILLIYYAERKLENSTWFHYASAFIIIGILCLLSFITTIAMIIVNDYPTLITAIFLPGNPRARHASGATNEIYQKPYTRISPYLVGLLLGYIFSRKLIFKPRHMRIANFLGWCVAIIVALAIIYGPWHVFKPDNPTFMTDVENIFYGTFHRFAWSVAVAWVIYACHHGMGGLLNKFLSWKAFIPLSRLTYGAYMMHIPVYEYYYQVHRVPNHIQANLVAFPFISTVILAYSCSFILAIGVELPVANLEKLILPS